MVQKCLAIEQASKDVQVLKGEQQEPGALVNKLNTVKTREQESHLSHYNSHRFPGVKKLNSLLNSAMNA